MTHDDDRTDWLDPNPLGVCCRWFWKALPRRAWWTPTGLACLLIDAVWH